MRRVPPTVVVVGRCEPCSMPSPIPVERFLPRDLSPSIDVRPCSSPLELSRYKSGSLLSSGRPAPCRLPPRLAWCSIDWEQVRVLEPLGSGGFGSVYRATYRGQTVALKKVKRCSKNRLASRQSFWSELNAARLCHPHVVRILAASASCPVEPGSPGTIIMEYAGSGSLHRRIYGRGPPLGKAACLRYGTHVADGLLFLHRGGVVHLDLKPANVLLGPGDLCKIGDFGCSQRLQEAEDGGEACSAQLRNLGGTYTHRAPELLRGEPVTAKADIYSFAVTLWQMVTRELPYTGDRQCVLYAVVAYDLRPEIGPAFLGTDEGTAARDIIVSCWAARPQDRPNSEELLRRISLLQSSHVLPHTDRQPDGPHTDRQPDGPHTDRQPDGPHTDRQPDGPHTDRQPDGPHTDRQPDGPHTDRQPDGPHTDRQPDGPHTDRQPDGPHTDHTPQPDGSPELKSCPCMAERRDCPESAHTTYLQDTSSCT